MAKLEINTHENEMDTIKFTQNYQDNGYGASKIEVDGHVIEGLAFGYTSDNDRIAGENLFKEAMKATNNDIYKAMCYIKDACEATANEIRPSEECEADGLTYIVDYENKKAWSKDYKICLADVSDLPDMPTEVLKALLHDRVSLWVKENYEELDDECECNCDCGDVCSCYCNCNDSCTCCVHK